MALRRSRVSDHRAGACGQGRRASPSVLCDHRRSRPSPLRIEIEAGAPVGRRPEQCLEKGNRHGPAAPVLLSRAFLRRFGALPPRRTGSGAAADTFLSERSICAAQPLGDDCGCGLERCPGLHGSLRFATIRTQSATHGPGSRTQRVIPHRCSQRGRQASWLDESPLADRRPGQEES